MPQSVPHDIIELVDASIQEFVLEQARSLLPPPPEPRLASLEVAEQAWRAYCDWYHGIARTNIWRVARFAKLASAGEVTKHGGTLCAIFGRKKVPELRIGRSVKFRGWGYGVTAIRNPDALAETLTTAECHRLISYLGSPDVWEDVKPQLASQP